MDLAGQQADGYLRTRASRVPHGLVQPGDEHCPSALGRGPPREPHWK
jgi:hypothetical protein